jgi:hypothetical protein
MGCRQAVQASTRSSGGLAQSSVSLGEPGELTVGLDDEPVGDAFVPAVDPTSPPAPWRPPAAILSSQAAVRRHRGYDNSNIAVVMPHVVNANEHTQRVVALYVRDVPDELHTAVKVEAAMAGVSMRRLVLDALEREVARRKAERGER